MHELPPLNALRAFVETARHLSATRAAAELHVTLGAVSHQLRALEEFLGVELFVREHRKLVLTEAGEQYFLSVSAALDAIRAATGALMEPTARDVLRVRAYTTFSLRWLIPRLNRFYAQSKGTELVLSTGNQPVDFAREGLDFAVLLGEGHWPGLAAIKLIPNVLTPVCSPALKARAPPLRRPADLRRHVLLQSMWVERRDDWFRWLQLHGVAPGEDLSFLWFESSAMNYQAAIEGQGLAMAQVALVQDDLDAGRLVAPFPDKVLDKGEDTYWLTWPEKRRLSPRMKRFRDWLVEESRPFTSAASPSGTSRSPNPPATRG